MALKLLQRASFALFLGVISLFGLISCEQLDSQSNWGGAAEESTEYYGGWDPTAQTQLKLGDGRLLRDIPREWVAGGSGKTKTLHDDYVKVHGHAYTPRNQGNSPSCVGQAVAGAVDFLAAVEINLHGGRAPPAQCDASVVYGLSRQEIGNSGIGGGGSHNGWACEGLQKYGAVAALNYPFLGIDLREFDAARAIEYGRTGCPDALEPIAKLHPVREYIQIKSWQELCDALHAGCPVVVGSPQGFGSKNGAKRDADGFLNPPRRLFFKSVWRHSMLIIGYSDEGRRGALILNSWGPTWISGPHRIDGSPEGSFFADKSIVEGMIARGDTYAVRGFEGYPSYQLWSK